MFSYFAYGLGIHSQFPIPEFVPAVAGCDVTIDINDDQTISEYIPDAVAQQPLALDLSGEQGIIYIKDAGVFLLERGEKIVVIPSENACEQKIRLALVGTVMAILLHQRGLFILHASAVNIDGETVAFLGDSGEGKSSLAAALNLQGFAMVTDDVTVVANQDQGRAAIVPAYPQFKLAADVAECLGYEQNQELLLHPKLEKRGYRHLENFPSTPLPIRCIYVLQSGSQISITALKPTEAIAQLRHHSQLANLFPGSEKSSWQQCLELSKKFTIYRLVRPRNLAMLPELAQLVTEHARKQNQIATAGFML